MGTKTKNEIINVPLNAVRLAGDPVEFADGNKGEPGGFMMTAYSGGVIPNHWYWGNLIIDLAGMKVPEEKIPVLRDHVSGDIVGYSEEIDTGKNVLVRGTFSQSTQAGQEVQALSKEGFPWQASIYAPPSSIEEVSEGTEVEVNGLQLNGPLTIFRQTVLREASFCALGADANTNAQAFKAGENISVNKFNQGGNDMELTVETLQKDYPEVAAAFSELIKSQVKFADFQEDIDKLTNETAQKAVGEERGRIVAIFKQVYGDEVGDKFAAVINPEASFEDMMSFAQDKAKADMLAKFQEGAPESQGQGAGEEGESGQPQGEEAWKAEFNKKTELQNEFGNVDTYVSYKKAESDGRIKVLNKG